MSDNNLARIVEGSPLAISGSVDKKDLVDIGISRVESRLIELETQANKALEQAKKDRNLAVKQLAKTVETFVHGKLKAKADALAAAWAGLGGRKDDVKISDIRFLPDQNEVIAQVALFLRRGYGASVSQAFSWKPSAVIQKANDSVKSLQQEVEDRTATLNDIRRKQAQLPRLDRQLRAAMAETTIRSVEGGEEYLDMISATTQDFIDSINA